MSKQQTTSALAQVSKLITYLDLIRQVGICIFSGLNNNGMFPQI